jgi:hypothetical protein
LTTSTNRCNHKFHDIAVEKTRLDQTVLEVMSVITVVKCAVRLLYWKTRPSFDASVNKS